MAMGPFHLDLTWSGSTTSEGYSRQSTVSVHGKADVRLSDGTSTSRWNPEELIGASLAQCHMLTFLALAQKTRLDVRSYVDHVRVDLEAVDRITRVSRITLAPTVGMAPDDDLDKAAKMFDKAHKYCFIANSISSEIVMEPTFEHV